MNKRVSISLHSVAFFMSATIFLAGCIHKEPERRWIKSHTNSEQKEYAIAESECLSEAYKAAPMTSTKENDCSTIKRGFSQGLCKGRIARQGEETALLRTKIYDGCMLGKGWEKHPVD